MDDAQERPAKTAAGSEAERAADGGSAEEELPTKVTFGAGVLCLLIGGRLRLLAYEDTRPKNTTFHSIPENTEWGREEAARIDLSHWILALGLVLIAVAVARIVWRPRPSP